MKTFLRNKLRKFIYQCIGEYRERMVTAKSNPYNIDIQDGSSIVDPIKIEGGQNISIGKQTSIGRNIWLSAFKSYFNQSFNPKILIGNNVNIGNYACITAINSITIGDNCLFSEYIYISDHGHGFDPSLNQRPAIQNLNSKGPVIIGCDCFLGYRVTVLPNVILGKNCVVGSHSVVTRSFPDYSMIAGNPARLIKTFSFEINDWVPVN